MTNRSSVLGALVLVACLFAPTSAAVQAQGTQMIRVGLYYGSSSLAAATLSPAGPSANTVYTDGAAVADVPGQSYVRDFAYRVLAMQTPNLAAAQAEVATLASQHLPAYLEELPNASYDVFSGPDAAISTAQAAAAALPGSTVLGPYGVLIPGQSSLAAAQATVQALLPTGQIAYPIALAQGWGVLVGAETSQAAAQALLPSLQPTYPTAALYTPSGSELEVQLPTGGVAFLAQSSSGLQVSGDQGVVGIQGKAYRGALQFVLRGTALEVVNTLPLEQYLYGVVPSEMPASWSPQALEAQAIASRTYALYQVEHAAQGSLFDVYPNTQSQAYGGYAAEQLSSNAAVDATANIVMTYSGQPIDAVFSADSGGATENSENVWGTALPYLRGVDELAGYQPGTWTITYSAAQIASLVTAWSGQAIGALEQVALQGVAQTFSGRPLDVLFAGSGGQYTVWRDSIRGLLRLPSTLFTLASNGQVYAQTADGVSTIASLSGANAQAAGGLGPLPATVQVEGASGETASYPLVPTTYTLNGRGNGHGLGMSQDGAQYMAEQGLSYQAILSHYYTGVAFSPDN